MNQRGYRMADFRLREIGQDRQLASRVDHERRATPVRATEVGGSVDLAIARLHQPPRVIALARGQ